MSESFEVPKTECPYCGKVNDLASSFKGKEKPEPGDISICIKCAGILVFDEELRIRRPTDSELINIQTSQSWSEVAKVIQAVRAFKSRS